jgi:hypothetical protein
MESLEMIQYDRKDVDLDEVKRMAQDSSKRIQKAREDRLNKAIRDEDYLYLNNYFSTLDLIKLLIAKVRKNLL